MADIDLKTLTPDTSLPTTGFLFGADSQATASPSVYGVTTAITTILGNAASSDVLAFNSDTILAREAANTLALRNGVNAQTFNLYGTYTNASNYERLTISYAASNDYVIGAERVGTGTARQITIVTNGNANAQFGDNVLRLRDATALGWSSTSSARGGTDLFLFRKAAANLRLGAADAALPVAQTLSVQSVVAGQTNASAAAYPFTITGSQGTGSGAGGSIVFQTAAANSGGGATVQNTLAAVLTLTQDTVVVNQSFLQLGTLSSNYFRSISGTATNFNGVLGATSLGVTSSPSASADVLLTREAAGVLGVRGTSTSVGAALSFIEQTAPASPAANIVRIYAEDNGAGKTRLMALFATGVAQQIAIEP
jgi:hypothetical protein